MAFAEKCSLIHLEIAKIRNYFAPTSQDFKKEIAGDVTEIKTIIEGIRKSIKTEGKAVKRLVDTVTSDKMKQIDKMERSLFRMLNGQNQNLDDDINYLEDSIRSFYG